MQWINDTWLLLAHHPYPEGVPKGTFIMWRSVVSRFWWFHLRCTGCRSGLAICIGKVKPEIVIVLSSEIDCWAKVPYVTVSPFWWNIQRQRELKVTGICVWCTSRMMCFKGFSGTNVWNLYRQFRLKRVVGDWLYSRGAESGLLQTPISRLWTF